ncbi:hypothetical protein [Streptomyces sp. NPDC048188]|uniref:hypothetical protein n=1 Tax=Streptomyces sp. NPDC048188 TaxID=3155749 RepID=UPI00341AEF5E
MALLNLVQGHFQQVTPVADNSADKGYTRYPSAPMLMYLRRCGFRLCLLALPFSFSACCLLSL